MTKKLPAKRIFKFFVIAGFMAVIALLLYSRDLGSNTVEIANLLVHQEETVTEDVSAYLEIQSPGVQLKMIGSDAWMDATDGQEVFQGMTVKTDATGLAEINYPSGTVTSLDSGTEVTMSAYSPSSQNISVYLTKGRVWSSIIKLLGGESYQTESPTMVATVRGTSYSHAILPDGQNEVVTTESKVEVGCQKDTTDTVSVDKDSMVASDCKTLPKPKIATKTILENKWLKEKVDKDPERKVQFEEKLEERKKEKEKEDKDKKRSLRDIISDLTKPKEEATKEAKPLENKFRGEKIEKETTTPEPGSFVRKDEKDKNEVLRNENSNSEKSKKEKSPTPGPTDFPTDSPSPSPTSL